MNNLPQRKQLRLKHYDYSQPGYYFVTICSQDKLNIFGNIVETNGFFNMPKMVPIQLAVSYVSIGTKLMKCMPALKQMLFV